MRCGVGQGSSDGVLTEEEFEQRAAKWFAD
jgi:hypothetical protein